MTRMTRSDATTPAKIPEHTFPRRPPVEAGGTFAIGDLTVHRLGYGAMQITGRGVWGPPRDHDEAIRVLRRAVELGVDLIDTADSYGPYVSEELIREALHPYPRGLVIATKAGLCRTGPDQWHPVGRPEYLRQECEMSLRRLGVERIDLFQLHRVDPKVPADEQFGLLRDLQKEGKVRHVGLSEVSVEQIEAAREGRARRHRAEPLQPGGPRVRGRAGLLRGARASASSPGSRSPAASSPSPAGRWITSPRRPARRRPKSPWPGCCARSPVMLPIPGTSTVGHLEENCAAAAVKLSEGQVAELDGANAEA